MDEFFESLVLIQTLRQAHFPVVLMCGDYWEGLLQWIKEKMLDEQGYISPEDLDVFTIAEDPETAVKIITQFRERQGKTGLTMPPGITKGESPDIAT
jgi:hypothetical protein